MVIYACSFLRGPAFTWAQPLLDTINSTFEHTSLNDCNSFFEKLRAAFGDPDPVSTAERELSHLKQGHSPASEYAATFQQLALRTKWNTDSLKYHFVKELAEEIQDEIATRDLPEDFGEYVTKIILLDNHLRERRLIRSQNQLPPKRSFFPNKNVPLSRFPPNLSLSSSSEYRSNALVVPTPMEITKTILSPPPRGAKTPNRQQVVSLLWSTRPSSQPMSCQVSSSIRIWLKKLDGPVLIDQLSLVPLPKPPDHDPVLICFDDNSGDSVLPIRPLTSPISPFVSSSLPVTLSASMNPSRVNSSSVAPLATDSVASNSASGLVSGVSLCEHIILDISLKTIPNQKTNFNSRTHRTYAMIDSGAMSSFMDSSFAKSLNLPRRKKECPVPVVAVDGRPLVSGQITEECTLVMKIGCHSEEIVFDIVTLGHYPVILGVPWLKTHDPTTLWSKHRLIFSSPSCSIKCLSRNKESISNPEIYSLVEHPFLPVFLSLPHRLSRNPLIPTRLSQLQIFQKSISNM